MKKYKYNFNNKFVIITGSSSGIGYEVAKNYLINGANILICSSKINKIKTAYKKLKYFKKENQNLFYKKVDISSPNEIKNLVNFAFKKFKKIDILINNAGIYGPKGPIEKINWSKWLRTIQINLFGSVLLCRELLPHFKKRNSGKIIQMSGGGAAAPLPNITGYAVSKVGIVRFIESLSEELKDYKIDVNSVAPGTINTNMLNEILKAGPEKIGKKAYKKALIQKKRGGSSLKNTCELILFLGSSYSDGIKGKLISSIWDDWKNWPKKINILKKNDLFTIRRITSKDRGISWGLVKRKSIYDRSLVPTNKLKR